MKLTAEEARKVLIEKIGKTGTFVVRESSSSRTTNLKTLTNWKLISVGKLETAGTGALYFDVKLESKKGAKRYFSHIEHFII